MLFCGAGCLPLLFGQSWDRYDQIGLFFVNDGLSMRYLHTAIFTHQVSGCVNGKRLLAIEIILIGASNAIVATHTLLIRSVLFQEFEEDEPPPPLQEIRRNDMQDPESLLERVFARKYSKILLDGDHFPKRVARTESGVELKKYVGCRKIAYRYSHFSISFSDSNFWRIYTSILI